MANPPPPTTATTAVPGFKLKLKLGGGGSAGAGAGAGAGNVAVVPGYGAATPLGSTASSVAGASAGNGEGAISNIVQLVRQPQLAPASYQNLNTYQTSEVSPTPDEASENMDEEELDEFQPEYSGNDGLYSTKKKSKKKASGSLAPLEGDSSLAALSKMKKPSIAPAIPGVGGVGRAWRKGLKGYTKPEGLGETTPPPSGKRRRPNYAEDGTAEDEGGDEFLPTMIAPGAVVTSDKWQNGLPGGNEQSRATAAMASAVNKAFPVGQPPKVSE